MPVEGDGVVVPHEATGVDSSSNVLPLSERIESLISSFAEVELRHSKHASTLPSIATEKINPIPAHGPNVAGDALFDQNLTNTHKCSGGGPCKSISPPTTCPASTTRTSNNTNRLLLVQGNPNIKLTPTRGENPSLRPSADDLKRERSGNKEAYRDQGAAQLENIYVMSSQACGGGLTDTWTPPSLPPYSWNQVLLPNSKKCGNSAPHTDEVVSTVPAGFFGGYSSSFGYIQQQQQQQQLMTCPLTFPETQPPEENGRGPSSGNAISGLASPATTDSAAAAGAAAVIVGHPVRILGPQVAYTIRTSTAVMGITIIMGCYFSLAYLGRALREQRARRSYRSLVDDDPHSERIEESKFLVWLDRWFEVFTRICMTIYDKARGAINPNKQRVLPSDGAAQGAATRQNHLLDWRRMYSKFRSSISLGGSNSTSTTASTHLDWSDLSEIVASGGGLNLYGEGGTRHQTKSILMDEYYICRGRRKKSKASHNSEGSSFAAACSANTSVNRKSQQQTTVSEYGPRGRGEGGAGVRRAGAYASKPATQDGGGSYIFRSRTRAISTAGETSDNRKKQSPPSRRSTNQSEKVNEKLISNFTAGTGCSGSAADSDPILRVPLPETSTNVEPAVAAQDVKPVITTHEQPVIIANTEPAIIDDNVHVKIDDKAPVIAPHEEDATIEEGVDHVAQCEYVESEKTMDAAVFREVCEEASTQQVIRSIDPLDHLFGVAIVIDSPKLLPDEDESNELREGEYGVGLKCFEQEVGQLLPEGVECEEVCPTESAPRADERSNLCEGSTNLPAHGEITRTSDPPVTSKRQRRNQRGKRRRPSGIQKEEEKKVCANGTGSGESRTGQESVVTFFKEDPLMVSRTPDDPRIVSGEFSSMYNDSGGIVRGEGEREEGGGTGSDYAGKEEDQCMDARKDVSVQLAEDHPELRCDSEPDVQEKNLMCSELENYKVAPTAADERFTPDTPSTTADEFRFSNFAEVTTRAVTHGTSESTEDEHISPRDPLLLQECLDLLLRSLVANDADLSQAGAPEFVQQLLPPPPVSIRERTTTPLDAVGPTIQPQREVVTPLNGEVLTLTNDDVLTILSMLLRDLQNKSLVVPPLEEASSNAARLPRKTEETAPSMLGGPPPPGFEHQHPPPPPGIG